MHNIYLSNLIKYFIELTKNIFINIFMFIFKLYILLSIVLYILINKKIKISSILSVLSIYIKIYLKFNNIDFFFDLKSLEIFNDIKNRKLNNLNDIFIFTELKELIDLAPIIKFFDNNLFFFKFSNNFIRGSYFKKKLFEKINKINIDELKIIKNHSINVFILDSIDLIKKKNFNKNKYMFIIIKDFNEKKNLFFSIKNINKNFYQSK